MTTSEHQRLVHLAARTLCFAKWGGKNCLRCARAEGAKGERLCVRLRPETVVVIAEMGCDDGCGADQAYACRRATHTACVGGILLAAHLIEQAAVCGEREEASPAHLEGSRGVRDGLALAVLCEDREQLVVRRCLRSHARAAGVAQTRAADARSGGGGGGVGRV